MPIQGVPYRHNESRYDEMFVGSLTQKIEGVRASAKKKEWQEDRLARVWLEDWLFTVRG